MANFEKWVKVREVLNKSKYAVLLGFFLAHGYNQYWFLDQLKQLGVYDYSIRRLRLTNHMEKLHKIWSYGRKRGEETKIEMQEAHESQSDNALMKA